MLFNDWDRLVAAYERAREDLLAERVAEGHWVGELAGSALATATAVSALCLVQGSRFEVQGSKDHQTIRPLDTSNDGPETSDLRLLIARGIKYLATQQNDDGGFGDTDLSHSNIATTMLVRAAFYLAGAAEEGRHRVLLDRAAAYIEAKGGIGGLRARYGKDKTFAVPILTNCALAGLVDWREVSALPFELAIFPQSWYRFFRLPVVSYAIPALVAIGQARFFQRRPRNPLVYALRAAAVKRSLAVLQRMQPQSGGYLEAIPLTSFVVMSLAGTRRADHPVAQHGVRFLLDTVRADGSWPIDTNLATWVTTLAINALEGSGVRGQGSGVRRQGSGVRGQGSGIATERSAARVHELAEVQSTGYAARVGGCSVEWPGPKLDNRLVEWLLSCQHTERHPFTGAAPGGWGWSDLSGAVPDCDDTAGALLALAKFAEPNQFNRRAPHGPGIYGRAYSAALRGTCWLVNLQNRDGGWPTFCRGWGTLPFDRSSPDLTAHALRALAAWSVLDGGNVDVQRNLVANPQSNSEQCRPSGAHGSSSNPFRGLAPPATECRPSGACERQPSRIIKRGFRYLAKSQRPDGSWVPLWFGNQDHPDEENPVYGTARVLLAYRDLGRMDDDAAVRGLRWLVANQNADGGWGAAAVRATAVLNTSAVYGSSVEETAWAVEGLLAGLDNGLLAVDNSLQNAIRQGVDWLIHAVEDGRHRQVSPVGFYFAKLWYYEKLYPLAFTGSALGEAVGRLQGAVELLGIEEPKTARTTMNAER